MCVFLTPLHRMEPTCVCVPHTVPERGPGDAHVTVCQLSYAHISGLQGCEHSSDRSRDFLPEVGGVPCRPTSDCVVEQWLGLFIQLWSSPGPGKREDVFRASLIMAASEEINRQGPAGMQQLLPLTGGSGGVWTGRRPVGVGGYTLTLAVPHLQGCTGL